MTDKAIKTSRLSGKLCRSLKRRIAQGEVRVGSLLPSIRELSRKHGLSPSTVHRSLKELEEEGFVRAEPKRGYRVMPKGNDPYKGCPIACIMPASSDPSQLGDAHRRMLEGFRRRAAERGWPVLMVESRKKSGEKIAEDLHVSRAFGAVVDSYEKEVISKISGLSIPAVTVDSWDPDIPIDSIIQDGQLGGLLAVEYLAKQGYKRIAWFGYMNDGAHGIDRFSGYITGMSLHGLPIHEDLIIQTTNDREIEDGIKLLTRADPPDAVVSLWQGSAYALKKGADQAGKTIGKDFELAAWCTEEDYDGVHVARFAPHVPPVVLWSVDTMIQAALARIAERRENPDLAPLRVKVPVRLRLSDEN